MPASPAPLRTLSQPIRAPINYGSRTVSGTTDTPSVADLGKLVRFTSSSAVTVTLDGTGWSAGDAFHSAAEGTGAVSFAAAGGNTILPGAATLRTQGSVASAIYLGSSTWLLVGDFLKGVNRIVSAISSPTTAAVATGFDYVYIVSAGAALTLPTAVGNASEYTVKNSDGSAVTVPTTSSQTVDGQAAPVSVPPLAALTFVSDGSNWWLK